MAPYRSAARPAEAEPEPESLGEIVSVHRGNHLPAWIGGLLIACVGMPSSYYFRAPALFVVALAAVLVWIGGHYFTRPLAVVLHAEGLEVRRWLRPPRTFAFDDCRSVFIDFSVKNVTIGTRITESVFVLEDTNGRRVRVTDAVTDAAELFKAIDRRCVRPAREDALQAFREGESLTFGSLVVDRRGIVIGDDYYAWKRVERVEVSPRRFFFALEGRLLSRSVPFRRVAFPFVLVDLIHIVGVPVRGIEGFVTQAQ